MGGSHLILLQKNSIMRLRKTLRIVLHCPVLLDLDVALAANGLVDTLPIRREIIIALGQRKVY